MSLLSSLTNRIFLASALLVIAAMGVVIYRVNVTVAAQAEGDLNAGLDESAALVERFNRTAFQDFVIKGQLIADLPRLQGAAATGDAPTVGPVAKDYQTRLGADLFVVVGRGDRVLAREGRVPMSDADIAALLAACRASADGTAFQPFPGGLLHVASIPMEAAAPATLIVGVSLDREAAMTLKAATNSEVVFVAGSRVVASSLDPDRTRALAPVGSRTGAFTVPIGDEIYIGRVQPLGPPAASDAPVALVLRSRTEHLRFLPHLHWQIALTGLAAVLIATVAGYLVARTVTRPLRALTGAMRDMAATGDLARTLPTLGRWDDEDVRLVATTFHQLTSALDRFQREAAMRERLSSLGRLSTVVAHEIRNPLMIIKSAVRGLRRHGAPEVTAAAASVDEEVARLNRVVTGVLDFARPIRFDLAPADPGEICREAVRAALAAAPDVPIEPPNISSDAPAEVVTDAERVRAVLVNVLHNAQQAVRARADRPTDLPPVRVQCRKAASGRWAIDVVDRGTGIAPEDRARLFEPFFTTHRGGSGLGLAIARNIVEGLGGAVTIDSQPGDGTAVHIELPERTTPAEAHA
jgi:signal transduction histidine kinase